MKHETFSRKSETTEQQKLAEMGVTIFADKPDRWLEPSDLSYNHDEVDGVLLLDDLDQETVDSMNQHFNGAQNWGVMSVREDQYSLLNVVYSPPMNHIELSETDTTADAKPEIAAEDVIKVVPLEREDGEIINITLINGDKPYKPLTSPRKVGSHAKHLVVLEDGLSQTVKHNA